MADPVVADAPVFSIDGRPYAWRDVVDYARVRGVWDEIGTEAAARATVARDGDVDPATFDEAAAEFRHDRGLLAADELNAWLARRGVEVEDWLGYIRRSLVDIEAVEPGVGASPEEVWAEAVCSGRLDELAEELAERLAVSPGSNLDELEVAYGTYAEAVASDEALDREIAAARVDWIRVRYRRAVFADADTAAEAALAVRTDGLRLDDVATLAGVAVVDEESWIEDEEPALASLFVGAREGELVGPVVMPDGLLVAEIDAKLGADPADPAVRSRAAEAVVERSVRRIADERVVWHERL